MAKWYCYLTSDHLQGFNKYKYSCIDDSPLSKYVTSPFWDWCLKFVPRWIAPNLLTSVGGLCMLSIFLLLSYHDYYYQSSGVGVANPPIPSWVWIYCSVVYFIGYTLDGIDGKQARRLKMSSPVGELLDHGVDSICTILIPLTLCSAVGRAGTAPDREGFFVVLSLLAGFYLSHCEKYITGTLYLPWAFDACQLGISAGYLVVGLAGVEIMQIVIPPGVMTSSLLQIGLVAGFFGVLPHSLSTTYYHISNPAESSARPNCSYRRPYLSAAILPWVPFLLMTMFFGGWIIVSPTNISSRDPRLFYFLMGVVFSNISCRLIISQMSGQSCQLFNSFFIPVVAVIGISLVWPAYELAALGILTAILTLAHVHYGISVVLQLCEHFNIPVLTVLPDRQ